MQDNENKMHKTVCFHNQQQSGILGGQWFQGGGLQLFISKYNVPIRWTRQAKGKSKDTS